jgi:hypothetical protein
MRTVNLTAQPFEGTTAVIRSMTTERLSPLPSPGGRDTGDVTGMSRMGDDVDRPS